MIEKIIFNVLAFTLFILVFLKLIRKNDSNYVYLLIVQFIGILTNFVELIFNIKLSIVLKTIIYITSIILPILVLILEHKKHIEITEIIDGFIANLSYLFKDNQTAEKHLKNIIEKYPNSKYAHKKLAKLYEKEEKKELEIEEYEHVIELDPNEKEIYIKVGKLYMECNRDQAARQIFSDILKEEPSNYNASMLLGDLLYKNEEFKEAIQIYSSALKYRPNDYEIYYNLGMTYTMLNDFQKAKENYENAARINSNLYHARYSLGQLSLIYGDTDEAEKYFEECINEEELEEKSYFNLARISIIKGDLDKAVNYANIAIEDNPNNYEKIQKDIVFIKIMDRLNKPSINSNEKVTIKKLTPKEIQISDHLEKTCNLVGKLNNDDMQMLENISKSQVDKDKEKLKQQEEQGNQEREDNIN